MDAKTNIKKRLARRHATERPERAPHRRPRDIVTRRSLENAAAVAASGGSANAALHMPAIAHECGIKFDLSDVAEIFKKTPCVADLKPGGRYVAKDMFEVGGIPLLMKTLLDHGHLHGDCLTVTGRTIAEIDGHTGALNVKLTDAEFVERETKWQPRATNHTSGALWRYARQVGPAVDGAVTHPGGAREKQCYADI